MNEETGQGAARTMRSSDGDEAALAVQAQAGDKQSLGTLLEQHRGIVLAVCTRMVGDIDLAQDTFQEAAVRALLGIGRLRGPEAFGAWLCGIALNVCRDWVRSPKPLTTQTLQGGIRGPELADPGPGPEELAEAADIARRVRAAVAALPDGQREAVEAYYLSGLTGREVAALCT